MNKYMNVFSVIKYTQFTIYELLSIWIQDISKIEIRSRYKYSFNLYFLHKVLIFIWYISRKETLNYWHWFSENVIMLRNRVFWCNNHKTSVNWSTIFKPITFDFGIKKISHEWQKKLLGQSLAGKRNSLCSIERFRRNIVISLRTLINAIIICFFPPKVLCTI